MQKQTIIFAFVVLCAMVNATQVNECGTGERIPDSTLIKISGCDGQPCKLKRRTQSSVEQKFVPHKDVTNVVNSVHAQVLGVPLPFVGVDGTSACESIYNADGTPAGCSLKKGVEYVYKQSFPILSIYPTISLVIHYELKSGDDSIACFEVPAKITN